tara:strand:+ start:1623 stop:2111 length:489 start_codon:yes stop_codon:yes gene_type:complete
MTSIIKVNNIQNSSGTSAMTIDSSGRVTQPQLIAFTAYANNNNSVSVSVGSKVPYDAVALNKGNAYNVSTYVFTAPVAGVYWFSYSVWNGSATTGRTGIYVNGTPYGRSDYPIGTRNHSNLYQNDSASSAIELAVNDTVDIRPYAAGIDVFGTNYFSGYLIG